MKEKQIWQQHGCGTDESTIRRVIEEFRTNGVENNDSAYALTIYLGRLDRKTLLFMYSIDDEATLQMLVDTLGVKEAFRRCCAATAMLVPDTDRLAAVEAELNNWQREALASQLRIEELTKKVNSQNYEIVTLKAKLYDTYEAMYNPTKNQKQKEIPTNAE